MNTDNYKGLTNAQFALKYASELAVSINRKDDGNWDEEDVLFAARKFKKFLDGEEDEFE